MMDFLGQLETVPRLRLEAVVHPTVGTRLQPTGFPDLGAAEYETPDGVRRLLVESAQSMANRLEMVCWDEGEDQLVKELTGLPYVRVTLAGVGDGTGRTASILEFHRLNSPYIMAGVDAAGQLFAQRLRAELGLEAVASKKDKKGKAKETAETEGSEESGERDDIAGVINLRRLASVCFKYDPNSLVHGIFLEKIAGRLRHPRALSAFIEAEGVVRVDSGGVKFDRVLPKPSVANVDAKGGYGNVPFHRTEYAAEKVVVFFSLDLAQIRGYGLSPDATRLLTVLSLWKIRRFLGSSMRLRSACELELGDQPLELVYRDEDGLEKRLALPKTKELTDELTALITACTPLFAAPSITELTWNAK